MQRRVARAIDRVQRARRVEAARSIAIGGEGRTEGAGGRGEGEEEVEEGRVRGAGCEHEGIGALAVLPGNAPGKVGREGCGAHGGVLDGDEEGRVAVDV